MAVQSDSKTRGALGQRSFGGSRSASIGFANTRLGSEGVTWDITSATSQQAASTGPFRRRLGARGTSGASDGNTATTALSTKARPGRPSCTPVRSPPRSALVLRGARGVERLVLRLDVALDLLADELPTRLGQHAGEAGLGAKQAFIFGNLPTTMLPTALWSMSTPSASTRCGASATMTGARGVASLAPVTKAAVGPPVLRISGSHAAGRVLMSFAEWRPEGVSGNFPGWPPRN